MQLAGERVCGLAPARALIATRAPCARRPHTALRAAPPAPSTTARRPVSRDAATLERRQEPGDVEVAAFPAGRAAPERVHGADPRAELVGSDAVLAQRDLERRGDAGACTPIASANASRIGRRRAFRAGRTRRRARAPRTRRCASPATRSGQRRARHRVERRRRRRVANAIHVDERVGARPAPAPRLRRSVHSDPKSHGHRRVTCPAGPMRDRDHVAGGRACASRSVSSREQALAITATFTIAGPAPRIVRDQARRSGGTPSKSCTERISARPIAARQLPPVRAPLDVDELGAQANRLGSTPQPRLPRSRRTRRLPTPAGR